MADLSVNTFTAQPLLRYLVAEQGFEPPTIPFRTGWEVFQKFLKIPADSTEDAAAFQASWLRENPDAPVLEVLLCRQLNDAGAPLGPLRRIVALQFLFDSAPASLAEVELWSADFPSVDRFLDQVEREPAFEYAVDAQEITSGDVLVVEED